MNYMVKALKRVIPDLEDKAFNKDFDLGPAYMIIWDLVNEIDNDMSRLVEIAKSLSIRFEIYAENITRGYVSGLDQPARSAYLVDLIEIQSAFNHKYKWLIANIQATFGSEVRQRFEKETDQL